MKYQKNKLTSGINLISIPIMELNSATILILVKAGSINEDTTNNGVSHFLEHMFFKGTKKMPTTLDLSSRIDSLGADYNAYTTKEFTAYYIKSASRHINEAISILGDMLSNSLFSETEIEKEKKVIIEELNMYEDLPMQKVEELFEQVAFANSSLAFDIIGTKDTIHNINRQTITEYYNKHYNNENMTVVVSGKFDIEQVIETINKSFNMSKSSNQTSKIEISKHKKSIVSIINKKIEQTHLCIGLYGLSIGSGQRYVMSILNTLFGAYMSSRLFINIREQKGLCYYISSDSQSYSEVGTWVVQAGVDINNLELAVISILDEFKKLLNAGVSETEMQRAVEYLKGRLSLGIEDSKNLASLYGGGDLLENKIRTPEDIIKGLNSVTVADVNQLAIQLIKDKPIIATLIGPNINQNLIKDLINKY